MSKIKVHIFHTGKVKVDKAIPLHERNPLAVTGLFRGSDKSMILPVSAYLIEHPKGYILIDSGWHSKYASEKTHRFFGLLDKISPPIIKDGESIDCQLERIGVKPSDIRCLYFSHLDFDHTSGAELVKDVQEFKASKEEIEDANKYFFRYVKKNWEMISLESFAYENTGIGPVGKSYDVFGDGSIVLVNTPGHSHGHFSVKVSGETGYIILGGDAAYLPESFSKRIIPGLTVDKGLAKNP